MHSIEMHYEDGKTKVELHDVRPVNTNEARAVFSVNNQPVYLRIFFHRPMDEDEMRYLYEILTEYSIIEMSKDEMERSIREDLQHQPVGTFELRCEFQNAFECCYNCLSKSYLVDEGAFSFMLCDEPGDIMKRWLRHKYEDFIEIVDHYTKKGMPVNDIAKEMDMSPYELLKKHFDAVNFLRMKNTLNSEGKECDFSHGNQTED